MTLFANRVEAGRRLASKLTDLVGSEDAIVLAIPRGGVVVGYEIANVLNVPIDIIIPRKIGAPGNSELAIGAVTEDGTIILDKEIVEYVGVSRTYIEQESKRQRLEIKRRLKLYRGTVPYPNLESLCVIIVDDGVATGSTIKAALASVRNRGAKIVVIAVSVGPPSTITELKKEADRVVCLFTPEPFFSIGQFYRDFAQTDDEEVIRLLRLNRQRVE